MGFLDYLKKKTSQATNFVVNSPKLNFVNKAAQSAPVRVGNQVGMGVLKAGQTINNAQNRLAQNKVYNVVQPAWLIQKYTPKLQQSSKAKVEKVLEDNKPKTFGEKAGRFVGENLPYAAIPAVPAVDVAKIASPGVRLLTNSLIRGGEGASLSAVQKYGEGKSGKDIIKEVPKDVATGAVFNAVLSPKQVIKSFKYQNISSKMDRQIPNVYSEIQNGAGKLYKPDVKEVVKPIAEFEQEITGSKAPVNYMGEKGNVIAQYDKKTGKLITWSTDNPNFAKRVQEGQLAFGLSTRKVLPSETGVPPEQQQLQLQLENTPTGPTKRNVYRSETPGEMPSQKGDANLQSAGQPQPEFQQTPTSEAILSSNPTILKNRGFVDTTRQSTRTTADTVAKIEGVYARRSNKDLLKAAQSRIAKDTNEALRFARTNTSDEAVAVGTLLSHQYQKAGNSQMAADLVNEMSKKLTEAGRTAQAASLWDSLSPEGIGQLAANAISRYNEKAKVKIPELSGEQYNTVVNWAAKIQNMEPGRAQNLERQKLLEHISELTPSPILKKFVAVIKAGLLTGVKTSEINTISNAIHGGMEVAKDIPATIIDKAISLVTGKRTKTFTIKGSGKGIKEGFAKGWDYLVSGYDERNVGEKLDYKRVNFGPNTKWLQKYEESIFRFVGSEDQPFYYGAKARSIADQAIVDAKNLGLKGKDFKAHVEKLMAEPTEVIEMQAVQDAERAVFQNSTVAGDIAKRLQEAGGGFGELLIPFGKTPSAVGTQVVNYSPVGLVKGLLENIGKGRFDQRAFAEAMGRGLVGTGIWAIGTALMNKGMMTLSAPTDDKERKQWELEGKQPNSIKIGDKWMQASSLGPGGNALIAGGYWQQGMKDGGVSGAFTQAGAGQLKSVADQPFLKGPSGIINAVNDPTRYAQNVVENTVGMTVPTQLSDIAKSTDPLQREQNTTLEAVTNKVPFLRERNIAKKDALGRSVPRNESGWGTYFDPMRSSKVKADTVTNELSRLMEAGSAATPGSVNKSQTIAGKKVKLTPAQLDKLETQSGGKIKEMFTSVMSDPRYDSLSDENKAKLLNDIIDSVRGVEKIKATKGLVSSEDTAKQIAGLSKDDKKYLQSGQLSVGMPQDKPAANLSPAQVSAYNQMLNTPGGFSVLLTEGSTNKTAVPKIKVKKSGRGRVKKIKVAKVKPLKAPKKLKIKAPKITKVKKSKLRKVRA